MAGMNTGNFQALLFPGLRKIWGLSWKDWQTEYDKIFKKQKSDQYFEDDQLVQGFSLVPQVDESQALPYAQMLQGQVKRYTHLEYRLGYTVSRAMYEDNRYRPMVKMTEALKRSYNLTVEHVGFNLINLGDTSASVGYDNLGLFSTAHLNPDQSTYSNRLTVAADLTMTSFEQALIDIAHFKSPDGLEMAARGTMLLVPPELEFVAAQILKSSDHPETPNRSVNPVTVQGSTGRMPFMVGHYLTDPDAWNIITDIPDGLQCFERIPAEFQTDNDFNTEDARFKVRGRYSFGWTDPRGIYHSPGA